MNGIGDPLGLFAVATPIALTFGALSWFVIERPALRLKELRWPRSRPTTRVGQTQAAETA